MKSKRPKPAPPYPGFPLFAHAAGVWAKTILGKKVYFGPWDDWQAALAKFEAQKPFLYAGLPIPDDKPKATLGDIVLAFREYKRKAFKAGDLAKRSFDEYMAVCDTIEAVIGKAMPIESLASIDHAKIHIGKLNKQLAKTKAGGKIAPSSNKRLVSMARMVFKFANEDQGASIRYRTILKPPSAKTIRKARNEAGERMFAAEEIRALLALANPQMKAFIYLGINCGFGNRDCATLPIENVDLSGGWHNYWRPKTQVERRCPLWPETAAALYAIIRNRKSGPVFVTRAGNSWARDEGGCPIAYEFRKLAKSVKVKVDGEEVELHRSGATTFYSLRRTFETIGGATGNQAAVDFIMGHTPSSKDMSAVYRQRTFDAPLLKVTDYVRSWLLGEISLS